MWYEGDRLIIEDVEFAARLWALLALIVVVAVVLIAWRVYAGRKAVPIEPAHHVNLGDVPTLLEMHGAAFMAYDQFTGSWAMFDEDMTIVGELVIAGGGQ